MAFGTSGSAFGEEGSGEEGSGEEGSGQEGSGEEGSGQEGSGQEGSDNAHPVEHARRVAALRPVEPVLGR